MHGVEKGKLLGDDRLDWDERCDQAIPINQKSAKVASNASQQLLYKKFEATVSGSMTQAQTSDMAD